MNPQTWRTVSTGVSKVLSWWIHQLSLVRFTSFSWRGCFASRMQDAFELRNTVSFVHGSFIFLLTSRACWKFFFNTYKTAVGVLEVPLDWNRRRSSWRKAFCVYRFLTTASFLHRKGKGKGFFGKIQKSSFWAQIQWNKRRRTCWTQIENGQAQSRRRTPMEEGKSMFEFCV